MGDFWAQALSNLPAAPAAPLPPQQPSGLPPPWWSPTPLQQPPVASQPQPQQQQQAPQQQQFSDLLQQDQYTTTRAQSLSDDYCPDCGSGNYLNIGGLKSRSKRCFDCGHNDMFGHTTAGISATSKGIPVHTARGQQSNVSDFSPGTIVGNVSLR